MISAWTVSVRLCLDWLPVPIIREYNYPRIILHPTGIDKGTSGLRELAVSEQGIVGASGRDQGIVENRDRGIEAVSDH